jgi:hypothetical protein
MKYNGAGKEYQQRMINGCWSVGVMVCNRRERIRERERRRKRTE